MIPPSPEFLSKFIGMQFHARVVALQTLQLTALLLHGGNDYFSTKRCGQIVTKVNGSH